MSSVLAIRQVFSGPDGPKLSVIERLQAASDGFKQSGTSPDLIWRFVGAIAAFFL